MKDVMHWWESRVELFHLIDQMDEKRIERDEESKKREEKMLIKHVMNEVI
jgi:hypothetical protein